MTTNKQALLAALTLPLMAALAGCGGISTPEAALAPEAAVRRHRDEPQLSKMDAYFFLKENEAYTVHFSGYIETAGEWKQGDKTVSVIRFKLGRDKDLKEALKELEELAAQSHRTLTVYDASSGGGIPETTDVAFRIREEWYENDRLELRADVFGIKQTLE